MKKTILSILAIAFFSFDGQSQFIVEDFESYEAGDYLGLSSDSWTTWNDMEGTEEDVMITDERASSGTNSIKLFSIDYFSNMIKIEI